MTTTDKCKLSIQEREVEWTCPKCGADNVDVKGGEDGTSEPICRQCDAEFLWDELL